MGHDREDADAEPTRPEIRVLGPLELLVDGRRSDLPGGRALIVLATLALHGGQVVSVDRLIEAGWGDSAPASVRTQLHALIGALRNALPAGPLGIQTRHPGYLLTCDPDTSDLEAFRGRIAEARAAKDAGRLAEAADVFEAALRIWRGPAFEGLASAYLEAEAQGLQEIRLQAFELYAHLMFGLGQYAEVVTDAERLVQANPLRETLRAQWMLALAGSGRQAEALAAYQQGRELLADELGVDPGADLRNVHQRILTGDIGTSSTLADQRAAKAPEAPVPVRGPVPAQLPADLADFTGRITELEYLFDQLSAAVSDGYSGPVVVSALAGGGGIGKTTLAVHVGHKLRAQFDDGQLYVNMRGTSSNPLAPADALARFLRSLGLEDSRIPVDVEERGAAFRSLLAGRRMLVVLDDARDAAQVRPLLPGDPGCGVIITSRSRLPGLDGCTRLDIDILDADDAERLFVRIVGDRVDPNDPGAVAEVLECCAGLPLAIRIAAARLLAQPGWTVRTLADELSDRRRLLDELQIEDRAVRTSFALSHAYLDAEATRTFALLGLWTGAHLPLAAAAALLDRGEREARQTLDALLSVHLLSAPSPDRYRFHDLIRVYSAEQAQASLSPEERREATGRLIDWYLDATIAVGDLLEPGQRRAARVTDADFSALLPDVPAALAWCGRQLSNLTAVVEQAAAEGFDEQAWQIAVTARAYYNRTCQWADWEITHQTAMASARRLGDRFAEAWAAQSLGIMYVRTRRHDQGVELMRHAEALRLAIDDKLGLATTTSNLGNAYLMTAYRQDPPDPANLEKAADCFAAAIKLYREVGDQYSEATTLTNLGGTNHALGREESATTQVQAGLDLARRTGNQPTQAVALNLLAKFAGLRGDRPAAVALFEEAISVRRSTGDRHGESIVLEDYARLEVASGDTASAARKLMRASELLHEIDSEQSQSLKEQAVNLQRTG